MKCYCMLCVCVCVSVCVCVDGNKMSLALEAAFTYYDRDYNETDDKNLTTRDRGMLMRLSRVDL